MMHDAALVLDFHQRTARRYVVRFAYTTRPVPKLDVELDLVGQPDKFGVEFVRRTGQLTLSKETMK